MFWFYLAIAIGIAFGVYIWWEERSILAGAMALTFGIFFAAVVAVIPNLIVAEFMDNAQPEYKASDPVEIVAMSDGSETSGTFFLASGTINGYDVYRFYTKGADGGMQLNSTYTSQGTIYEREGALPTVTYWHPQEPDRSNFWTVMNSYDEGDRLEVFIVPPGTVKQEFNLDTQ